MQNAYHAIALDERRAFVYADAVDESDGSARANDAQVTQVWFPGVHCDVGGSYAEEALSNITLRWMIDKAMACGMQFDETALAAATGAAPFDPLGQTHESWQVVPWGLPQHRSAPDNAVLANTVAIRNQKVGYTSAALRLPLGAYAQAVVI